MTEVSFEECFREQFPRLVALGRAMSVDPDTARELAQETFLRLHRNWATVAGYEHPDAWLRRVMANLLIDHHRARASERRLVERLRLRTERSVPPVEVGTEWADLVADLPVRQRLIMTLFYGEDRSIAEIAEILEIAPNSVKSALSKARDTLRGRWER